MTQRQYNKICRAFPCGGDFVFAILDDDNNILHAFLGEFPKKNSKNDTVTIKNVYEITDKEVPDTNEDDYFGDVSSTFYKKMVFNDPRAGEQYVYATGYLQNELIEAK